MSLPRSQVIAVVVASVAGIALTVGGVAILSGANRAQASSAVPAASISSAAATVVPTPPDAVASAEPGVGVGVAPSPAAVETMPFGPVDANAIAAGLRQGGYRFTVKTVNFASFAAATPLETGVVPDSTHYVLEWPQSTFISRYVRDGDSRRAWIGDSVVDLMAGDGWERTPDEMLPFDFYMAAIDPWTDTLPLGSVDGTYAAKAAVLTSQAESLGVAATDWTLAVTVDGRERLVAARFEGSVRDRPFQMDIEVAYEDPASGVPPAASEAASSPGPADVASAHGR